MNSVAIVIFSVCIFILDLSHASPYENSKNVRNKRQSEGCRLPPKPNHGDWKLTYSSGKPGELVQLNTVLTFSCEPGYKLSVYPPYMICGENWDAQQLPTCDKLCSPIYSTSTTKVKCKNADEIEIDCNEVVHGGSLTFDCAPYYEEVAQRGKLLCINGDWSSPKPVCTAVCGKKVNDDAATLIWNGKVLKTIKYPWIVAIYRKDGETWQNICGGNIIGTKVVLTAAHCVTNFYGDLYSPEGYKVAGAKLNSRYQDPNDPKAQYLDVEKIVIPSGYRGDSRRYYADVAVIVTKKSFKLGPLVQPVCFLGMEDITLHPGYDVGEIAGWGITESNNPSEVLRFLEIPFKSESTCEREFPKEWADRYAFSDKICAGFYNKNMSVCKGDSGSGLVFKNVEDNRYYIHGVVSIAPSRDDGLCNFQQNSLYTRIKTYYNFVENNVITYSIDECVLPNQPANGRYVVEGKEDKGPGDKVLSNDFLKITCNDGYAPTITKISCESATFNKLRCQLVEFCPKLFFPRGTNVICTDESGNKIDCGQATAGAKLSYTCPKGYNSPTSTERTCKKGFWGDPKPSCVRQRFDDALAAGAVTEYPEFDDNLKVICTYRSWEAYNGITPEDLNPHLCTHIYYAYAGIWENGEVRVNDDYLDINKDLYRRITELKKVNRKLKVILSLGGDKASNNTLWSLISSKEKRVKLFIGSTRYHLEEYGFDGLNIDWNYPEPAQKEKYIEFLRKIKDSYKDKGWHLTASCRSDPEGTGFDPKRMNEILDWVVLKTYDMFTGDYSAYTGEHSALYPSSQENDWDKKHLNVDSVTKLWLDAGLTKEKLVISACFYGRTFKLEEPNVNGLRAPIDGPGFGSDGGTVKYADICSTYDNWTAVWNDEQKSAYKYKGDQWFSYDNKDAIKLKGKYVKEKGLGGVNVWPVDADDVFGKCGGQKFKLLKHIHQGLGHRMNWDA